MKSSFPKNIPQPILLGQLLEVLGGTLEIIGPASPLLSSVASPAEGEEGSLVFCTGTSPQKLQALVDSSSASVIVTEVQVSTRPKQTLVVVADPLSWYIRALNFLFTPKVASGIHATATVPSSTTLGQGISIGAGTCLDENCRIGDGVTIGVNCYLGPGTLLEENVFIQDNVSLGGVGLGYHTTQDKQRLFFPHMGAVLIACDVVIGSGTVIVRGQLNDTIIGARSRIGNLVNIGHNVSVGVDCAISSSSCIAGGTSIGDRCNIATGVTINAKVQVEDDCQVGLGSVVTKTVVRGQSVFGCPAKPLRTMRRF